MPIHDQVVLDRKCPDCHAYMELNEDDVYFCVKCGWTYEPPDHSDDWETERQIEKDILPNKTGYST